MISLRAFAALSRASGSKPEPLGSSRDSEEDWFAGESEGGRGGGEEEKKGNHREAAMVEIWREPFSQIEEKVKTLMVDFLGSPTTINPHGGG